MRTQTWQLALGLVLAGFAVGVQNAAAHSPEADVRFTVHVCNYADVDSKTLASAERVAAEIFRKAGIESRWVDAGDMSQNQSEDSKDESSLGLSHIWLHILSPAMAGRLGLPSTATGLAPGTGPDRRVVDVFYNRVQELAQKQMIAWANSTISPHASLDQILGAVIAHEIGHLLLNQPSHSKTGIMRGDWYLADLYDVAYGCLLFTPHQAEVIRAELVRRAGQRRTVVVAGPGSPTLAH